MSCAENGDARYLTPHVIRPLAEMYGVSGEADRLLKVIAGDRIRYHREKMGLSLTDVARVIRSDRRRIGELERGRFTDPVLFEGAARVTGAWDGRRKVQF